MAYSDEVLADSPQVYWRLNENPLTGATVDSSGNSRPGLTINGSPGSVTGIPGAAPNAAGYFDGTASLVGAVSTWGPYQSSSRSLTIEFWYKGTDVGTTDTHLSHKGLISCYGGTSVGRWIINLDTTGKVRLYTGNTTTVTPSGVSTTSINDDNYHHVVCTIAASTYATEIWIDGSLEDSDTGVSGASSPGMSIMSSSVDQTEGTLDEVAIYFSVLDATRIAAHYSIGSSIIGAASHSLVLGGSSIGYGPIYGSVSDYSLGLVGTVLGAGPAYGASSGTVILSGSALGLGPSYGTSIGILTLSGSGSGVAPHGSSSGILILDGSIVATPVLPTFGVVGGYCNATVEGALILNDVPMKTPAWMCHDLTPLWQPPGVRGLDRILPTAAGVVPRRRRPAPTVYSLDFTVSGFMNPAGNAVGDGIGPEEFEQLEYNLDFLRLYVLDTRTTPNPDGTVPGVLTMPSGEIRTANVHVLGLTVNFRVAHVLHGVLDISIPEGGFA